MPSRRGGDHAHDLIPLGGAELEPAVGAAAHFDPAAAIGVGHGHFYESTSTGERM